MASTYADLKTEVADFLHRDDLTQIIPTFIQYAEKQIGRILQTSWMETYSTDFTVASTQDYDRPTNSNGIRYIRLNTDPVVVLEYMTPENIDIRWMGSITGKPEAFSIVGDKIRMAPTPDAVYSYDTYFYQIPDALSESNQTNTILDNAPDLLLYGALLESAPYLKDDSDIPIWSAKYQNTLEQIRRQDEQIKYPTGSQLQTRIS